MISYSEEYVLNEAEKFVNPKFGIIKYCVARRRAWGEENYFQYACEIAQNKRNSTPISFPKSSTGASSNDKIAKIAAIAEGIERYCSFMKVYEEEDIYYANNGKVDYNFFPFEKLPACTDAEYDNPHNYLSKPNKKQKYHWTKCTDLISGTEIYVPSVYIFLNYQFIQKDELIFSPNSTGTACGITHQEAIVNAIFEALERDAIMITWLNQIPRKKIDIKSITNEKILQRLKALTENGSEIFLFDIKTDFNVPIVLAIRKSPEYPYVTVAAAAKRNYDDAICRALDETFSNKNFGLFNKSKYYIKNYNNDFTNLIDFDDHFYLYNKPEMIEKLNFLVNVEESLSYRELVTSAVSLNFGKKELLNYFISEFGKRNFTLIAKDLTTKDIQNSIFKVVKVFIPELVILSPNHNFRFLNNPRIKNVLPLIDCPKENINSQITKLPHPFA